MSQHCELWSESLMVCKNKQYFRENEIFLFNKVVSKKVQKFIKFTILFNGSCVPQKNLIVYITFNCCVLYVRYCF